MLTEYALLKLQTANGEEHFIHSVPVLLCSKRAREPRALLPANCRLELLPITNIIDTSSYHALIYFRQDNYYIVSITPIVLNSTELSPSPYLQEALALTSNKSLSKIIDEYIAASEVMKDEKSEAVLGNISRLTVMSPSEPEVYYICQPSTIQQRLLPTAQKQNTSIPTQAMKNLTIPSANGSKWSSDDHEQLKKLLLQYGYGRWKQIQRSSLTIGGKL